MTKIGHDCREPLEEKLNVRDRIKWDDTMSRSQISLLTVAIGYDI